MRRIIIFADGTWNTPANKDGKNIAPTNVFQSFINTIPDVCSNGDEQIAYYHEGVGTGDKKDRIKGGTLGVGIDDNIKILYRFIVEHYTPGTELFLFGFSRGSYTVRSLVGLIRNCGILKKYNAYKVDRAFYIYRSRDDRYHPNSAECKAFQQYFSYPLNQTPIKFIGVWDTVGALGIPFKFFHFNRDKKRFHDVTLSGIVQNAYHAIAINENRVFFRPTLWQQQQEHVGTQKLEQCWFRGVHCDIGGGYKPEDLALNPLNYLVKNAVDLGLQTSMKFNPKQLQAASNGQQNEEWKGFYKILPRYYRIINGQNIVNGGFKYELTKLLLELIMKKEGISNSAPLTNQHIHQSVLDYYGSGNQIPINLLNSMCSMKVIPYCTIHN